MHILLIAGTVVWCLAVAVAPIAGEPEIYHFFSAICHQDPDRSWFLAGSPLAACIRCTSIYLGFLAALLLRLSPNSQVLRLSIGVLLVEFIVGRTLADLAAARALTGAFFGMAASPFVEQGLKELFGRRRIRGTV